MTDEPLNGIDKDGNPCKAIEMPQTKVKWNFKYEKEVLKDAPDWRKLAEQAGIDLDAVMDMNKMFHLGQVQQYFPDKELVIDLETSQEAQAQVEKSRVAALQAKYGSNFEPAPLDAKDEAGNTVIGRWKQNKEPEYRRRWVGDKYVYDRVDTE